MAPLLYRTYRTCLWLRALSAAAALLAVFAGSPAAVAIFVIACFVAHLGAAWSGPATRSAIDNHITTRLMGEVFPGKSRRYRLRVARFKNRS